MPLGLNRPRARQLRLLKAKSLSVDSDEPPPITGKPGSFKHLAETLVRLQNLRSRNRPSLSLDSGRNLPRTTRPVAPTPASYLTPNGDKSEAKKRKKDTFGLVDLTFFRMVVLAVMSFIAAYIIVFSRQTVSKQEHKNPALGGEGGWIQQPPHSSAKAFCSIHRRYSHEIPEEEFFSDYFQKQPVIIKFKNKANDWIDSDHWTVEYLLQNHGHENVKYLAQPVVPKSVSDDMLEVSSFKEFLIQLFDSEKKTKQHIIMKDKSFLEVTGISDALKLPTTLTKTLFSLKNSEVLISGPKSSIHYSSQSHFLNAQIFGQKRWFISATPDLIQDQDLADWLINSHMTFDQKPMECMQEAGDLIYIPEGLHFASVSDDNNVGINFFSSDDL